MRGCAVSGRLCTYDSYRALRRRAAAASVSVRLRPSASVSVRLRPSPSVSVRLRVAAQDTDTSAPDTSTSDINKCAEHTRKRKQAFKKDKKKMPSGKSLVNHPFSRFENSVLYYFLMLKSPAVVELLSTGLQITASLHKSARNQSESLYNY